MLDGAHLDSTPGDRDEPRAARDHRRLAQRPTAATTGRPRLSGGQRPRTAFPATSTLLLLIVLLGAVAIGASIPTTPAIVPAAPVPATSPQEQGPLLVIDRLSVDPVHARAGEPVTVSVVVANNGASEGTYSFDVAVDGVDQAPVTGELPSRGRRTHFLTAVGAEQGTHNVAVGGALTSFIVPPAEFTVTALGVTPSLVRSGDTVRIAGRVANLGGVPGTYRFPVDVGAEAVATLEGFLPPGSSQPFLVTPAAPKSGVHNVSVGERTASFGVLPPVVETVLRSTVQVLPTTAVALDDRDGEVAMSGNEVRLERIEPGVLAVELPVDLAVGRTLRAFREPTAGIDYDGDELRVRFPGPRYAPTVTLVAQMEPPEGVGTMATGTARDLRLLVEGVNVNMALAGDGQGIVGAEVEMRLADLTPGIPLVLHVRQEPSPSARQRLERAARAEELTVTDVVVELERESTVAGNAMDVEVTLDAQRLSDIGGIDRLRLAWMDGDGDAGLVPVRRAGTDDPERVAVSGRVPGEHPTVLLVVTAPWNRGAVSVPRLVFVPAASAPGQTSLVVASVENDGSTNSVASLSLQVNGVAQRARTVALAPGQQTAMEFLVRMDEPGRYLVEVEGTRRVMVVERLLDPSDVTVEELRVSPSEGVVGTPVAVSVLVTNNGRTRGLATTLLEVNGVPAETLSVVLTAGQQARVETVLVMERRGRYVIRAGGEESAFDLTAMPPPAAFTVIDLSVTPETVNPGEEATVTFLVANGGGAGTFHRTLTVGDEETTVGPVLVEAFATVPMSTTVMSLAWGVHRLAIGNASVSLSVREARETDFRVTDLRIEPGVVSAGGTVSVMVKAANENAFVGTDSLTLRANGTVVETRRIWLAPGTSGQVAFTYEARNSGETTLDVNGVIGGLEVTRLFPVALILGGVLGVALLAATAYLTLRRFRAGALAAG